MGLNIRKEKTWPIRGERTGAQSWQRERKPRPGGRGGEIRKSQVNGREPASFLKGLYLLLTAGTRGGSTLAAVLTVTNKEP